MKRGEIYRVVKPPGNDPQQYRYFVVVSRNARITSKFSTVNCAPIYSMIGLSTQVTVGIAEGLKIAAVLLIQLLPFYEQRCMWMTYRFGQSPVSMCVRAIANVPSLDHAL